MIVNIRTLSENETVLYAANELARYSARIDACVKMRVNAADAAERVDRVIFLAISQRGAIDPTLDDVIDIDIDHVAGSITGSNPRSVLMGVYEFLKSLGCMWVRPGADGEHIPEADLQNHTFQLHKRADCRFRGQCIEGAVSFENVRDTILWLPKVNMNLFMMEQVVPYNYMSRWYKHTGSTTMTDEEVSFEQIAVYTRRLEYLIHRCGLQLHALGHGYQFEPYGIQYHTADDPYTLSEEAQADVALVGGKRALRGGSPNYTQLCMSQPHVRQRQVNWLVHYLEKKPHIDFLHVWLADATNNHCECPACQTKRPSDFYVMLLNELDAALTARAISTRIVFILYTDTLWEPETERIQNPSRFIMTCAPTRDYNYPYCARRASETPPYRRNQYCIPADFSLLLSFTDAWKRAFDGPKFLFEYYFYTDHYFDPGHMSLARHIVQDVRSLPVDFDGIMSDQTQRAAFPTALPIALLGETLFSRTIDDAAYIDAYFVASYGDGAPIARTYLTRITTAFSPEILRSPDSAVLQDTNTGNALERKATDQLPEAIERLRTVAQITADAAPAIEKALESTDTDCHRLSWRLLQLHGEFCRRYAEILLTLMDRHDHAAARLQLADMRDWLSHIEEEIQPHLDVYLFVRRVQQIIEKTT